MTTKQTNPSNSQGSKTTRKYTPLAPEGYTYLTVGELAERIRVSKQSVIRRCQDGGFPGAIKCGSLWRIPVKEELCK